MSAACGAMREESAFPFAFHQPTGRIIKKPRKGTGMVEKKYKQGQNGDESSQGSETGARKLLMEMSVWVDSACSKPSLVTRAEPHANASGQVSSNRRRGRGRGDQPGPRCNRGGLFTPPQINKPPCSGAHGLSYAGPQPRGEAVQEAATVAAAAAAAAKAAQKAHQRSMMQVSYAN